MLSNMNNHSEFVPLTAPSNFFEHYSQLSSVLTAPTFPVSTLAFDELEELLWQGNITGHVSSYYSDQLTKYTSFSVANGPESAILQFLTGEFGVLCLTKDELKLRHRRGLPLFSYESTTLRDTLCMARLPSQLILLGGQSNSLIEFDLQRMRQMRTTDLAENETGCCLIRHHPKFICCADLSGRLTLRDTQSLNVCHSFTTHSGSISDFDVHGNYLITCGYSNNRLSPDRFVMVFDLRTCRLVTPIQSIFPPTLLRFVPAFTSKFCLVSHVGQFQLLDVAATTSENCTAYTHQVSLATPDATITSMDVSSSGQSLAFGDSAGVVTLFGTNTNVSFNQYSRPTEFADSIVPGNDPMSVPVDINDNITPFTIIPHTYTMIEPFTYGDKLISDFSNDHSQDKQTTTSVNTNYNFKLPKIDKKILDSMNQRGDVGYAPNPFKSVGRISYIRGRIGVIGVTKISDDDDFEPRQEAKIDLFPSADSAEGTHEDQKDDQNQNPDSSPNSNETTTERESESNGVEGSQTQEQAQQSQLTTSSN